MNIKINTTKDDGIGPQLLSIRHFLIEASRFSLEQNINLDFTNFSYSPPLLSVFFSSFIERYPQFLPTNIHLNNYLGTINFPNGIKPEKIQDWKNVLDSYRTKSYLPIICFSTSKQADEVITRNNIISHVNDIIKSITNIPTNYFSAISYLISELTDNIVDHSRSNTGWISFQYYKTKGYLDLCIADTGIGYLRSYQEYKGEKDFSHITNHLEALNNVIQGNSTKHINERGYGVHTSREIIIKGLNSIFVLLNGNALMINYDLVDFKCNYDGTLAMFRFPCKNFDSKFNIYSYIE